MMVATLQISHPPDAPVRLLQITDPHLGARPGTELLGMDTDFSLDEVLKLVRHEQRQAQLLLCTGDIASNGAIASYRRFHKKLQPLQTPMVWLAGNHDNVANMTKATEGGQELSRLIDIGRWRIVMLNSQIPKKPEGRLGAEQRSWLATQLAQSEDRHVLVCLHHHVLPVGCSWLDSQRIADATEFLALLSSYACVRAVLSGHVHQHNEQRHTHFRLLTTPSACIQFAERSADFRVDTLCPGYRWLELAADGTISTGISRVTGVEFSIDFTSAGY
jgi:Icc protein